ncbi:hypothetical protein R6Z07F_020575 [Ovis aries]
MCPGYHGNLESSKTSGDATFGDRAASDLQPHRTAVLGAPASGPAGDRPGKDPNPAQRAALRRQKRALARRRRYKSRVQPPPFQFLQAGFASPAATTPSSPHSPLALAGPHILTRRLEDQRKVSAPLRSKEMRKLLLIQAEQTVFKTGYFCKEGKKEETEISEDCMLLQNPLTISCPAGVLGLLD